MSLLSPSLPRTVSLTPPSYLAILLTFPLPVTKYCEELKGKVDPLMAKKKELTDSEMEKFSPKDPEAYPIGNGCGLSPVGVV